MVMIIVQISAVGTKSMMMKVFFLYLDKARIVPKPGPREKKIWVAAAIHT